MQVLIADDDRTSRRILEVVLTRFGYTVQAVSDGTAAWEALQKPDAPQLAILDWMMPGMEGVDICRRLRQNKDPDNAYFYVILLTAKGSKENIIQGMDAGADDYIVKPFDHNEMRVRIRAGQRIVELHKELLEVKKELFEQSRTDALTGVLNRRALLSLIEGEHSRSIRGNTPFSLAMLDIDHFKSVNDTHGHAVGDAVLKEVVNRINGQIRPYDSLGRFGGEEFLIVVPGTREPEISNVCERIRKAINATKICVEQLEIPITVSLGTTTWMESGGVEEMICAADAALYQAKNAGRNRVAFAPLTPKPSSP